MLFSIATRSLVSKRIAPGLNTIRLMSTVSPSGKIVKSPINVGNPKREIHSDSAKLHYAAQPTYYPDGSTAREAPQEQQSSDIMNRFKVTAEVTVSKIFPAGFGWQSSSILAEEYLGFAPDTFSFALTTGLGDAVGVMAGHCAYFSLKKSITGDEDINMERETQTGLLLGSAAFCSGTAWQPLVDVLQAANLSFAQVFVGTWVGCGTAFYLGMRGARTILSGPFKFIHEPTYENSINDKSLSAAIGGATGFFVGTDTAYLPGQNFLINAVGISGSTPALTGCAIAGSSTSLGFLCAQGSLNVIYPTGKLWNDDK